MAIKSKKYLLTIFWALIVIFILIVAYFIIPASLVSKQKLFPFAAVLGFLFFILGIVLVFLTIKQKIKGKLRIFLILTGVSAICPFVFSILHNLFYALAMISSDITLLKYLMEILHAGFFIIAIFVSPLMFLVCAIGTIILFKKNNKK